MQREMWDRELGKLTKLAEYWRREPQNKDCDTSPIRPEPPATAWREDLPVDYAEAVAAITIAMAHLNEAIPSRQPNRIRAAYALLAMGKRALGDFLETKNVV